MGRHSRRQQEVIQAFTQPPVLAFPPPAWEPKPMVNIDVLGSKNATVAKVTLSKHEDWTAAGTVYKFEAAESAKREQGDVADPKTGELLALSRAFLRLSRQLSSEAAKRVKAASEEKEAAEQEALLKKMYPPKVVQHRPLEEWEKIQQQRYENQGGKFDLKRIQKELNIAAEATRYNPEFVEQTVKYNPADAALLARWIDKDAHSVEVLKAKKAEIEAALRALGEVE